MKADVGPPSVCVGLRRSGTTSQKRQMDLNLSPPPCLRYPCRPAEMCAWKRAGPRAIILPLIFLFEIKPQREHMRESEEGQKTRLWITSSEGGGVLAAAKLSNRGGTSTLSNRHIF